MDNNQVCKEKLAIVLPSLDPDESFNKVVDGLVNSGFRHIIIVDDGSDAEHQACFTRAGGLEPCVVLSHGVNRGKGRALKTAFEYVVKQLPEVQGVITIDGDGQHLLEDIIACGEKMLELDDKVVLGCRDFDQPGVPAKNAAGNKSTSRLFKLFCGIKLSDTQTGLRAIPARYLDFFSTVEGERFEYETNMLLQMKAHGIGFYEQSIATIYDPEDYSTHYNALKDSARILKVMAKYFFSQSAVRYAISSVASWVIDNLLYLALFNVFAGIVSAGLISPAAHVCARALSSVANFNMNNFYVFGRKDGYLRSMLKYYCLCLPQTAVSVLLVGGAVAAVGAHSAGAALGLKVIIEGVIFCLSYLIQKKWVFKED